PGRAAVRRGMDGTAHRRRARDAEPAQRLQVDRSDHRQTPAADRRESGNVSEGNHIDLPVLAQCAEGALPEDAARSVRDHLAECRSCLAAYVDAVRYRAAWLADPQAFQLDAEDRALLQRMSTAGADVPRPQRPQLRRWIAVVGGVAAVLALSVL